MQKHTKHALVLSFALHIGLILAMAPLLVTHFKAEKERIALEILEPASEERVRRRVLPTRSPILPKMGESHSSTTSPASPIAAIEVTVPKAPVHAEVPPDIVTHADVPQADTPSPVANASAGEDGKLAGPVVAAGHRGTGVGGPERGGRGTGTFGNGKHLAPGTGTSDGGLAMFDGIADGLGIFGTEVMPGHGLTGQVYVPGQRLRRMPDFEALKPIYTFIAANLDVPLREYTSGFPTPDRQTVVEDFAIRFRGVLAVDTPGKYTFWLLSDDGSKLYIDDTLVIDNDGLQFISSHSGHKDLSANVRISWKVRGHLTDIGKRGSIELTPGTYPFEIQYFQGPRYHIALQWFYQPPNADIQIVPPEVIYPSDTPRIPNALRKLHQRLKTIESDP